MSQVQRSRIDHAEIVGGYELGGTSARSPTNQFRDVKVANLGHDYAIFQRAGNFTFPEPTINLGRW